MFYYFILLQTIIEAAVANINIGITEMKYEDTIYNSLSGIKELKKYYNSFKISVEKFENHTRLYDKIVEGLKSRFISNYRRGDAKMRFKVRILKNYKPKDYEKICDEIKRNAFISEGIKKSHYNPEFQFAYEFLIEFATFAMENFQFIHQNRQKHKDADDFRKYLIRNPQIFDNYILSVNFLMLLMGYDDRYTLLHNYKRLTATNGTIETDSILSIVYNCHKYRYRNIEANALARLKLRMYGYYISRDFSSNQKIFELENMETQKKYLKKK
ncbi:hypothetical protein BDAP_001678 [Binucleata daphniae]